jgi:DNA-3-methyladenine glycosylase II
MNKRLTHLTLLEGVRYLAERDEHLATIVSTHGPPPLWEREQGFSTLIRVILEQQVSLNSAKAAYDRLERAIGTPTPEGFARLTDEELKRIGFSRQKTLYGRELATAMIEGRLDLPGLDRLNDEDARKELMKVKGIGPWTADIYLICALGRPNIWPKGDLALEVAAQRIRGWAVRPTAEKLADMSRQWQPWRAVAARLLWHFYLSEGKKETT